MNHLGITTVDSLLLLLTIRYRPKPSQGTQAMPIHNPVGASYWLTFLYPQCIQIEPVATYNAPLPMSQTHSFGPRVKLLQAEMVVQNHESIISFFSCPTC